jgi:AcrR family transcriptional regulator
MNSSQRTGAVSNFGVKKRDVRRQQIIDVSTNIFYEYGYHKASIRNISERMGITKAAIYYHFHDKEEILYTIVDQASNELLFAFQSAISEKKDPIENLRNLILKQIYYSKSQRKKVKILVDDLKFLSGVYQKLIRDKQRTIFHLYRANIEDLQNQGRLRNFNVTTATFGIFGMINWIDHWFKPEKDLSIEQVAEDIVNILLYGLLSEPTALPNTGPDGQQAEGSRPVQEQDSGDVREIERQKSEKKLEDRKIGDCEIELHNFVTSDLHNFGSESTIRRDVLWMKGWTK